MITPVIPNSTATHRLSQSSLGSRQQFREHSEIEAAGGAYPQRCVHIDADHVPSLREPQLALAGKQDVPRLMLLPTDQGVLAVGAELTVRSWLASRAG